MATSAASHDSIEDEKKKLERGGEERERIGDGPVSRPVTGKIGEK